MKKLLAVIGVLFAFAMGLKLYNNANEIKTTVQPQPEAVEAATPANNSTEIVTLEGKAQVSFPNRQ